MEFLRDTHVNLGMWLVACDFVTSDCRDKKSFDSLLSRNGRANAPTELVATARRRFILLSCSTVAFAEGDRPKRLVENYVAISPRHRNTSSTDAET